MLDFFKKGTVLKNHCFDLLSFSLKYSIGCVQYTVESLNLFHTVSDIKVLGSQL